MGILCKTTDERSAGLRRARRQGVEGGDAQLQLCRVPVALCFPDSSERPIRGRTDTDFSMITIRTC